MKRWSSAVPLLTLLCLVSLHYHGITFHDYLAKTQNFLWNKVRLSPPPLFFIFSMAAICFRNEWPIPPSTERDFSLLAKTRPRIEDLSLRWPWTFFCQHLSVHFLPGLHWLLERPVLWRDGGLALPLPLLLPLGAGLHCHPLLSARRLEELSQVSNPTMQSHSFLPPTPCWDQIWLLTVKYSCVNTIKQQQEAREDAVVKTTIHSEQVTSPRLAVWYLWLNILAAPHRSWLAREWLDRGVLFNKPCFPMSLQISGIPQILQSNTDTQNPRIITEYLLWVLVFLLTGACKMRCFCGLESEILSTCFCCFVSPFLVFLLPANWFKGPGGLPKFLRKPVWLT